ncbi:MAG: signal peptidase II [Acidobacteriota bacterium]
MKIKNKKKYILITGLIIIIDQISKFIIKSNFQLYEHLDIIDNFFRIFYIKNSGAVWGLFSNQKDSIIPVILTILSITALLVVIYIFLKTKPQCKLELVSLSFISGGAIGNIIDRIMQGYVVDFIEIYIKSYRWPTFNIADSFISIGILLLIISIWKAKCQQFT